MEEEDGDGEDHDGNLDEDGGEDEEGDDLGGHAKMVAFHAAIKAVLTRQIEKMGQEVEASLHTHTHPFCHECVFLRNFRCATQGGRSALGVRRLRRVQGTCTSSRRSWCLRRTPSVMLTPSWVGCRGSAATGTPRTEGSNILKALWFLDTSLKCNYRNQF